jgi:hypothetical protein
VRETRRVRSGGAQGNVNAGPITNYLPGFYGPSIADAHLFAETALDLSELLDVHYGDPCFSFGSIWMHSRSSDSIHAQMKDYVRPRPLIVRNCAASGTKFLDLDADGTRDEGEPGLPGWFIWADYDGDGVRDADESGRGTDPLLHDTDGDGRDDDGYVQVKVGHANACITLPVSGDAIDVSGGACPSG